MAKYVATGGGVFKLGWRRMTANDDMGRFMLRSELRKAVVMYAITQRPVRVRLLLSVNVESCSSPLLLSLKDGCIKLADRYTDRYEFDYNATLSILEWLL